jgi:hypothetical protein
MPKLTQAALRRLIKKTGRHSDGGGLYFRVLGDGKAYFVYRFRVDGREREASLGPYPKLSLKEAREKHIDLRKAVKDKIDPLAERHSAKTMPAPTAVPTFGDMADAYVQTHEATWRNAKHRYQWRQTLTDYCGPTRDTRLNEIATADVLTVLKPLCSRAPETASRLRGRIQTVLDAAQAHMWAHRRGQGQPSPLERPSGTTCWRRRRSSACADTTRRCPMSRSPSS